MKIVVEPTRCLAAAVCQKEVELNGKEGDILVSGGNIDFTRFAGLLLSR